MSRVLKETGTNPNDFLPAVIVVPFVMACGGSSNGGPLLSLTADGVKSQVAHALLSMQGLH